MNDLVINQNMLTDDQIALIKRTVANGATDDELAMFIYQCNRTQLDPFSKQIYFVKRRDNKTGRDVGAIQTGIDGYRAIAERTGKYAGSDDYRFDEGLSEYEHIQTKREGITTATVTVYKIVDGVRCPFTATARWKEYYPGGNRAFFWDKMSYLMIGKCSEALALRKAFPYELSGVYTKEEMEQAGVTVEEVEKKEEPKRRQSPAVIEGEFKKSEIDHKGNLMAGEVPPAEMSPEGKKDLPIEGETKLGDASPLKYLPEKLELLKRKCKEHGYDVGISKVETGVTKLVDDKQTKLGDLTYGRAKLLIDYLKLQDGITDKKKLEYVKQVGKGAIQRVLASGETWDVALAAVKANSPEPVAEKKSLEQELGD
jgi:phage recombination protein Bet